MQSVAILPFEDPDITAKGDVRAKVSWNGLSTLWLNTGTLCNIACQNCYIESSPRNDRLVYLSLEDVLPILDEVDALGEGPKEIGITGGEPFMCPDILKIMTAILERGHRLLLLTNAMQPMMRNRIQNGLLALKDTYGAAMILRVSMDHHSATLHDDERGSGAFAHALKGLTWLADNGFKTAIAGRQILSEDEPTARAAYGELISLIGLSIDPLNPSELVLFPEMTTENEPPEITTDCWSILNVAPHDMMCASQRMLVKHKGDETAVFMPCTLLAYDERFKMGPSLHEATKTPVSLNHRWCAEFCVLGGGNCSA
ncbi:MAG: radical SAM protein [Pseudomonadota bacterium]